MAENQQHAAARPDAADLPPSHTREGGRSDGRMQKKRAWRTQRSCWTVGTCVRKRQIHTRKLFLLPLDADGERDVATDDRPPPPHRLMVLEGSVTNDLSVRKYSGMEEWLKVQFQVKNSCNSVYFRKSWTCAAAWETFTHTIVIIESQKLPQTFRESKKKQKNPISSSEQLSQWTRFRVTRR